MANIPLGGFGGMEYVVEDPTEMANAMQALITFGSQRHQIPISSLKLYSADTGKTTFASVAEAVADGTRFFDAILYFCIPQGHRPAIEHTGTPPATQDRAGSIVARKLFMLAFYMLTRGGLPQSDTTAGGTIIPNFLSSFFGMTFSPNQLATDLGNVNIRMLTHTWIRHVDWTQISNIAQNRFGLGVAGYRTLAPFKLYPREQTAQHGINMTAQQLNDSYATARLLATRGYDWNIHPITRPGTVLAQLGALNPNLENLMLACFNDATLNELVNARVIYQMPVRRVAHANFLTWNVALINWNPELIFNQP